jgi:UDP-N-acetylmuramoyl-L-alanyl-D-glutamate--2,6-diaminopimelate ligase
MTVGELAASLHDAELIGDPSVVVTGVQYFADWLQPGDLFAALAGSSHDGHDFAAGAVERGAPALLVERQLPLAVPQIVTGDARAALAPIATRFHGDPSRHLDVFGITGTDGKTTTSYILRHLLREAGDLETGLIGTVGIETGPGITKSLGHQTTPESNLVQGYLREMVERGVTHAILEATSHGLAMHRLDGVRFRHAGITNMTTEHLEFHRTVANYWRAKGILAERVAAEGGTLVINADDPGARSALPLATGAAIVLTSSRTMDAHLYATDHSVRADGTTFTLHADGSRWTVDMPLIGAFNIDNALIAIGLARSAGLDLDRIVTALSSTAGVPGRMQLLREIQPFTVVVDFAHTPDSLRKILTFMRTMTEGRLIVVSGSAGERDTTKRPLQGLACTELADLAIFTNEDPRHEPPMAILRDIAAGATGNVGEDYLLIEDRREAIDTAFAMAEPGDLVVLAGKGHETSIVIGDVDVPWNEESVARELLRRRFGQA